MRSPIPFHNLPIVLLIVCSHPYNSFNLHADAVVVVAAASGTLSDEAELSAEHTDTYNIRHGRSKVRHSNEKEQLLWALRPQNAHVGNDGIDAGDASAGAKDEDNEKSRRTRKSGRNSTTNNVAVKNRFVFTDDYGADLMPNTAEDTTYNFTAHQSKSRTLLDGSWNHKEAVSSIQTGNGELFGSDYWQNSFVNGSLIKPLDSSSTKESQKLAIPIGPPRRSHVYFHKPSKRKAITHTEIPDVGPNGLVTTEAPVTHRIRKLHMKKIMESIRNGAASGGGGGGFGVKLSRSHHRSLMTAEKLQGRPTDVELVKLDKTNVVDDAADGEDKDEDNSATNSAAEMPGEDAEVEADNFNNHNIDQVAAEAAAYEVTNDSDDTRDESIANAASQRAEESSAVDSNSVESEDSEAGDNDLVADMEDNSDVDDGGGNDDVDTDVELDEVLQLADELDIPINSMEEVGEEPTYQNDDYPATTTLSPTYTTTKPDNGSEELSQPSAEITTYATLSAETANLQATEMLNDDIFEETTSSAPTTPPPTRKVTTKLKLIPKTPRPTKLTLLPTVAVKGFAQSKAVAGRMWVNQTQNRNSLSAQPKWKESGVGVATLQLDATQRSPAKQPKAISLPADFIDSNDLRDIIDVSQFESAEHVNDTSEYDEDVLRNATKHFISHAPPSTLQTLIDKAASSDDYSLPTANISLEPNQQASTSVGGIGVMDRQQAYDVEEINFEQVVLENTDDITMDDGYMGNRIAHGFPVSKPADLGIDEDGNNETDNGGGGGGDGSADGDDDDQTSRFLVGVVDAANEDEIYDWDEISRNNRRNLMRGRDVVTKFLQIVETQHLLGANCEAGTSLNLGEGVVDRYAQDRFRVEAEVAVNRANMLTRIFKMTAPAAQADVNLLHASVLSMVEFDDDIFAAGNCFDWNEHPSQTGLFCPFAYRLPAPNLGAILAKDLSMEYHYLGNTSEWFFQARKNAEKVIIRNEQYLKSFHLYSNKTDERIEDDTLAVKYEDGRWSKPYYDCGGGNIWMLTYTVPFFGYENGTYHFKGTSGIDIDLRRVDIDQCPQRNSPGTTQPLNIFAGTDKCKQRTTMCEALKGLGFRRGSYKCACRKGYYFPDTMSTQKFFNGSLLEEEYEKLMLGRNSTYNIINEYECLPCAEGCDYCEDGSPCIAALNWPMRTSILVLACTVIGLLPPAAWFTFRYQQVKVVRAASPALLRVIALGAFFIYCTNIVMYPNPNLYTCTARIWLREIGFSLTYGALMLKTWRISVIFRVRSAKAVKITDAALLKRLGIICGVIGTCLLVRTLVSPPDVVVGRTADDLKAFLCKTDYWDYTFTSMEVLFLAWGVRLCIMVRKAPSEFNESRFISMAIYNEFLLTCFLNVSMLFLQSPANPDLLYIIFFCHTQLTVTLLLCLIFGSKVYIVLRSGKSHQETIGMGAKSSGAKFNFRPQVRTFANPSSVTTSTMPMAGTTSGDTKLSDQEALEEIRQLSVQLQRIQEMAPPKGVAVMTISSLLDGLKTPGGMIMVAAAASQAATSNNQLAIRPYTPGGGGGAGGGAITSSSGSGGGVAAGSALPLLSLNSEMEKYNQQLQATHNNNVTATAPPLSGAINNTAKPTPGRTLMLEVETSTTTIEESVLALREDRAINTDLTRSEDFHQQALGCAQGHIICTRCLVISKEHYFSCRPFTPPHGLADRNAASSCRRRADAVTCQQLGSPQPEGSISFSNIKLECMCSQPDLDLEPECDVPQQRRINVRSAATNTPPSTGGSDRRRSGRTKTHSPSWQDLAGECQYADVSYRICDNCKNKYRNSNKCGGRKFRKSMKNGRNTRLTSTSTTAAAAAAAIKLGDEQHAQRSSLAGGRVRVSQTRSNDLLDRQLPKRTMTERTEGAAYANERPKVYSTDDIIFYTTTDESNTNSNDSSDDDGEGACSRLRSRRRELTFQSAAALSTVSGGYAMRTTEPATMSVDTMVTTAAVVASNSGTECAESAPNVQSTSNIANSQSVGGEGEESSTTTTTATAENGANGTGRAKRPDKLILDLNDRSKYTKEVSV